MATQAPRKQASEYKMGDIVEVLERGDGHGGTWYVCGVSFADLKLSRSMPTDPSDWQVSVHLQRVRGSAWCLL